jgi:cysteine synthase
MDSDSSEGIEIIGYDPSGQTYLTHTFDNKGNSLVYEAALQDKLWNILGRTERFAGMFGSDGKTLTGTWERLSTKSTWVPWMDIELTKKDE